MSKKNEYEVKDFGNFLSSYPAVVIRWFLALSMAANDTALASKMTRELEEAPPEASFYHRLALSFLRELAKAIDSYKDEQSIKDFLNSLDSETQGLYKELLSELASIDDGSLVKSVLKPIRDISFHYPDAAGKSFPRCEEVFRVLDKKEVRFLKNTQYGVLDLRYLFADNVAGYQVSAVLDMKKVDRISRVAICLMGFVDHVMEFLVNKEGNYGNKEI